MIDMTITFASPICSLRNFSSGSRTVLTAVCTCTCTDTSCTISWQHQKN